MKHSVKLNHASCWFISFITLLLISCADSSPTSEPPSNPSTSSASTQTPESGTQNTEPQDSGNGDSETAQNAASFCSNFVAQPESYFCEDFTNTSPVALVGSIPPMSFRDQTFRPYTRGQIFSLPDPDANTHNLGVVNLHTDRVDGIDFSVSANTTAAVASQWDITAHSRDGYVQPGSGSGFNDNYWWNENQFMGDHGNRCGKPIDLDARVNPDRDGERAFTFMEQFFDLPENWDGNTLELANFWDPERERDLGDAAGIHHIVRYEDMIYLCADHLMTAAYGSGASKLSLTPDHLLDTSSGQAVIEFSVSTYRTAGRDYWQLDLTSLADHLQLPEGDVVADANGKAINGFAINTELNDGMTGPADVSGGINVFRTMMVKDGVFLDDGNYIDASDPDARFVRAQIANPGNAERLELYAHAPTGADWVLTHTNYNQIMSDYLRGEDNPDMTLHNVTSNRQRTKFRLTINKTPSASGWSGVPQLWDQVSLCLPDYADRCIGEYIVPELPADLLVQFTHYAYNTTKSCAEGGEQPHKADAPTAVFQSTCHPNTYHWDNFYLSPTRPFEITKATARTEKADATQGEIISLNFTKPAPPRSKLRFTALTGGSSNDSNGETSLEVSFDGGNSWHRPERQAEPENSFDKFRSYYTGAGEQEFIPAGVQRVLFRADNPSFRDAYWIRDASFWSFQ